MYANPATGPRLLPVAGVGPFANLRASLGAKDRALATMHLVMSPTSAPYRIEPVAPCTKPRTGNRINAL